MKKGFTLIELLTVIAIIGILAALVVPSFTHFRMGDANAAANNTMVHGLNDARQFAIAHRSKVFVLFETNRFQIITERTVGDQPGIHTPRNIGKYELPEGEFIPSWKFGFKNPNGNPNITIGGVPIWCFNRTFGVPFTNTFNVPFIEYDEDGKLISETNSAGQFIDTDIPLVAGSVLVKSNTVINAIEASPNLSTNDWRLVHVDHTTGIATLNERVIQ